MTSPRSQGGASGAAVEAAAKGYEESMFSADPVGMVAALSAAHDPALGLDMSVNLRDVVAAIEGAEWWEAASYVQEHFTASSSSEGSPGDG